MALLLSGVLTAAPALGQTATGNGARREHPSPTGSQESQTKPTGRQASQSSPSTPTDPPTGDIDQTDPADLADQQVRPAIGPPLSADRGAPGLEQMLRRLGTRASLLMIVAHPDDEDGGMLTYESRGVGARVGMLTLTRGEGGQNLMSADFNDALGLVRTRELLAADRFFAADQMFGTEVDFGFSKTKEEAFAQWTHQRVLYDAVRAVRLYRPLVLTSVFVGAPSDGHGQHQVSGEITQEVFTAAADPKLFPEMGLPPWAPAKVFGRVPFAQIDQRGMFDYATSKWVPTRFENYVTGKISIAAPKADVIIPEGEFSATLGKSYVQFAREGLALQRTQIGGTARLAPAGAFDVGYTLYGSRVPASATAPEKSLFDGIDISLEGVAALTSSRPAFLVAQLHALAAIVADAHTQLQPNDLARIAPTLRDGLLATEHLIAEVSAAKTLSTTERFNILHELRVKQVQFNHALVLALGLTLDARLEPSPGPSAPPLGGVPVALTPGEHFTVSLTLEHTGAQSLNLAHCTLRQQLQTPLKWVHTADAACWPAPPANLPAHATAQAQAVVPTAARGQRPPFLRDSIEQPFYTVPDPALRNAPTAPLPIVVLLDVQYGSARVRLEQAVAQPAEGVLQPATVVPPVNVSLSPAVAALPLTDRALSLHARIDQSAPAPAGSLRVLAPPGWTSSPAEAVWPAGDPHPNQTFTVTPTSLSGPPHDLRAIVSVGPVDYRESFHAVGYPGLIRDVAYEPARSRVQGVDLRLPPDLRVAYLPGTGDAVESALREIGVSTTTVSVADLAAGRLAGYDALVLGVRAYAAHPELAAATPQLLDYLRAGGTVLAQYNTTEYTAADAPYPLSLGANERVVEETDPVHLLLPEAQALRWPNRITEHDFDGWTEERGHGFMGQWAPEYAALTEVHDPGEDPQRGGLLVAPVGKGVYVYCAFALYRQLPEGVPGAYRLLANLVSLGRRPR